VRPVNFVDVPDSGLVMLPGQNVAGTTKKTTVVAMMLIGFSVSNMLVPLSFKASEAPAYKVSRSTCSGRPA
jgi:hypothetical protein